MKNILFVTIVALFVSCTTAQDENIISHETSLGEIRGTILRTFDGKEIQAFRGIRYANITKRFAPAEPLNKWTNVYDATKDGPVCPQPVRYVNFPEIAEDCLFLNIYTTDPSIQRNVLVHIHGGANYMGMSHSSELGPEYMLDNDIVLVTISYRLGAFGFLTTGTEDAPGNLGYKDQVLALRWVKEHISDFGGNPDSITISGQSAGGMSVSLHLVSPMSVGLFHKAIVMSAASFHHYHVDNKKWTRELAHYLQCPMFGGKDIVECLRTKTWESIINACITWEPYGMINMKWNYEIEESFGQERFLDLNPTDYAVKGEIKRVPIMSGLTTDEFRYDAWPITYLGITNDLNENFEKYIPELLTIDPNAKNLDEISSTLYNFYVKSVTGKIEDESLNSTFGLMYSDAIISHGVHRFVKMASKYNDVYYYMFEYLSQQYGRLKDITGTPIGVTHVDELIYLFHYNSIATPMQTGDVDAPVMKMMTKLWSSFVINGKPSYNDIVWNPSNSTGVRTLFINETGRMGEEPYQDRFAVWDKLFPVKDSALTTIVSPLLLFVAIVTIILN